MQKLREGQSPSPTEMNNEGAVFRADRVVRPYGFFISPSVMAKGHDTSLTEGGKAAPAARRGDVSIAPYGRTTRVRP